MKKKKKLRILRATLTEVTHSLNDRIEELTAVVDDKLLYIEQLQIALQGCMNRCGDFCPSHCTDCQKAAALLTSDLLVHTTIINGGPDTAFAATIEKGVDA